MLLFSVISLLVGVIIGSAITYFLIERLHRQKIVREYESRIQQLKEEHYRAIKEARNKSTLEIDESQNVVEASERSEQLKKTYSIEQVRKKHPRAYEPWSAEEDQQLRLRRSQRASIDLLAAEFQRKPGAIRSRLKKLGLL